MTFCVRMKLLHLKPTSPDRRLKFWMGFSHGPAGIHLRKLLHFSEGHAAVSCLSCDTARTQTDHVQGTKGQQLLAVSEGDTWTAGDHPAGRFDCSQQRKQRCVNPEGSVVLFVKVNLIFFKK